MILIVHKPISLTLTLTLWVMDNIKEQLSNNSLLGILRLCISIPFLSTKTCLLIFVVSILCPPLLFCAYVAFTCLFGTLYHQILNKEIVLTLLLPIIHQIVFLVFTLVPSTIAMFLTIASVYTSEPIPFFSFFRAIFYIFLHYFDTFFLVMAFVSLYRALLINTICLSILAYHTDNPLLLLVACIVLFLFIALQFFTEHWLLACFVSMFEGIHGMAALKRSRELIKGRTDILVVMLFFLVCEWIQLHQEISMLGDKLNSGSIDWRVKLSAVPTFGLLFPVILFGISAQTVLYFFCNQEIDKVALSKRLAWYLRSTCSNYQ